MKIAHLTYDMRIGGAEYVIKTLIKNAKEEFIICLQPHLGPLGFELKSKGFKVINLNWESGFSIKTILNIRRVLKEYEIDILHCHQYTPWCYGALSSVFMNTKVIFTEHGRFYPDVKHTKRRFINPILIALTAKITTISNATKIALIKYEYIPEKKITVIYNGIDIEEPKEISIHNELGIENHKKIIATISRIDPIKNIKLIINALNELSNRDIHFVIIGDGDESEKLELHKLVNKFGLSEKVSFLGFKNNPVDYLNAVDLFLLPSFNEGASMTLLQAMYLQKTIIATKVGGTPELLSKNEGFLIGNDCKTELITLLNNIDEIIKDKRKYQAKKAFFDNFTKSKMQDKYRCIYQEV